MAFNKKPFVDDVLGVASIPVGGASSSASAFLGDSAVSDVLARCLAGPFREGSVS
jgi:hypothetical protein